MKKILTLLLMVAAGFHLFAINEKPFVIPELKEWKGKTGFFKIQPTTKIIYPKGNNEIKRIGEMLSADLKSMYNLNVPVSDGKAQKGDIVFKLKKDDKLGEEGYEMNVTESVNIQAPTVTGLYWATRSLLQMSDNQYDRSEFLVPQGDTRDWPDYALRGFMIDTGRKFIPLDFLEDYVDIMSYYKMNFLQVHLNDNGFPKFFDNDWGQTYAAFRLESESFPGLAAEDGHYKKDEFRNFQKEAASKFVEVMPEIDVPAHVLAFVHYKPELGSEEYGKDHFDLFKDEVYEFTDTLLAEYLKGDDPVFVGPRVSIGTDEYSNKDSLVVEKFRYFTDRYIKYVESFGKQPSIWGSLTHAKGETPVQVDNVLMNAWYNGYADPEEMIKLGYKLVSIPDAYVYIVPAAGYYYDYLNTKKLYEGWTPANVNGKIFEERHPSIEGGMFAVWNDHVGNGISTRDIHHRTFPALQTIATKTWTGESVSVPFEEFDTKRLYLSEAPNVNLMASRVAPNNAEYQEFWSIGEIKPNSEYPYQDVGYDYKIDFNITGENEQQGTELFRSNDAVFYLADPITGMVGFSRDGYLNTFPYKIEKGKNVKLSIEGDNGSTSLYVDGKLLKKLDTINKWGGKDAHTKYVPTLVFPLNKSGNFKSKVKDFKASQK